MIDNWIFNYCSLRKIWKATTRDNYFELFNGQKGNVITSSSFQTLVEIIEKTKGQKSKIEELINQNP